MTRRPHLPWLRVGGRLLVAGCLLLALWPPPLPFTRAPQDLIVLVDESLSMSREDTDASWLQLRALLAGAPANTRLRLVRFAATPVLEEGVATAPQRLPAAMPRGKALDRSATDIAAALQQALRLAQPGRPGVMVLVSDTAATLGDTELALQAVFEAGLPLYLMAPGPERTAEPARLQDLQLPSSVNVGDQVRAVALLESASAQTVVATLEIDSEVVQSQELALDPGKPTPASFVFVPHDPGVSLVTVRIARESAPGEDNWKDEHTRALTVLGPAPLLYLSRQPAASPIPRALQLAGWEVIALAPTELQARSPLLQHSGAIIIDDLAIADMNEASWQALVDSVRVDGKGLAVLGGPRSFGAGAYRHSTVEKILPVTAEAADPQAPAAVIFLLDSSGSMGREQNGPSLLSLARQAVAASVQMLLPDDYLGIITFATDARVRLPLATLQTGSTGVIPALAVEPGGGTLLEPALRLALEQLQNVPAVDRRLIVLVTDGSAGGEDLQDIARDLNAAGISVIALAVGRDPNRDTLRQLTAFNRGQVLAVTDDTTLPRLMTDTVATQRAPAVEYASVPKPVQPLPFPLEPVAAWPPLSAYMVSKARPAALVHLQSDRGDPLFATGLAGAGRVAVLPGGLGHWAGDWWRWPGFGAFLGGLAGWLDPVGGASNVSLEITNHPAELGFGVDMQTGGEWDSDSQPRLLVDEPTGGRTELTPALQAPGHYRAQLPVTQPGLYQVTLQAGGQILKQAVYREANTELHSAALAPARLPFWLEQGWLLPWPGGEALLASWPRDASGLRRILLPLALFSYLLLLFLERGLAHPVRRWLRARLSR